MKTVENNVDENGFVSEKVMDILKETSPIFCVDGVLVPESKSPEAILVWRDEKNFAVPNQYWLVGGRQKKGQLMAYTLKEKIKLETGLNLDVKEENQLFAADHIHVKDSNGLFTLGLEDFEHRPQLKDVYHTPTVCYLVRTPPFKEIKDKINPGNGNSKFKLYTYIDESLHPHVKKAIRTAWQRVYGKTS